MEGLPLIVGDGLALCDPVALVVALHDEDRDQLADREPDVLLDTLQVADSESVTVGASV